MTKVSTYNIRFVSKLLTACPQPINFNFQQILGQDTARHYKVGAIYFVISISPPHRVLRSKFTSAVMDFNEPRPQTLH